MLRGLSILEGIQTVGLVLQKSMHQILVNYCPVKGHWQQARVAGRLYSHITNEHHFYD
jgi:hypothetical protein